MFGALKALANSEKAIAVGVLVIAATAMVFTGHLDVEHWLDYTETLAMIYVGGKTIQGTAQVIAQRGKKEPAA